MRKSILVIFGFLLFPLALIAQDTIRFSSGLAVASGSRYGREAVYTDILAWKLFTGSLKKPVTDTPFDFVNNTAVNWIEVKADSMGRFRLFNRRPQQTTTNPFLNPGAADRGSDYLYLTYIAAVARPALLYVQGNSGSIFNGQPHMGDPYSTGYMMVPVMLKKGMNELYVRGTNIWPQIILPKKKITLSTADLTLPHIIQGRSNDKLTGAMVIVNTGTEPVRQYQIRTRCAGKDKTVTLPVIPAMATRKVRFDIDASAARADGKHRCEVVLLTSKGVTIDETTIELEAPAAGRQYAETFVSEIDGSVQYYAVTPQTGGTVAGNALFLSVHGAGVEAIGQARAYKPKDWGTLVAPTNRRPRGFNWEDWGRLDALEVLKIATDQFKPDPQRVYLTGHSMGGHGTWFLGATYPDKWAAIAPCAGYASLKDYGSADGRIPDGSIIAAEQVLLRAGNQSDVPKLATNYTPLGVYIFHGDADRVVPVSYARQMRSILSGFHPDFSYYEYPGGEHWFGDHSVDWDPLFNFFKWHRRLADTSVSQIDFSTASPGISATYRWATIWQQEQPLQYSRMQLQRDIVRKIITGKTNNISTLRLALGDFGAGTTLMLQLDSTTALSYTTRSASDSIFLRKNASGWQIISTPEKIQKNPDRYGTFKEAFNHRMIFVVGTGGGKEIQEAWHAKAKYDAESWYYRGNGAVDIVTDKEYLSDGYEGRNVILYGNAETNAAWKTLLSDCEIQVGNNFIQAGENRWQGSDLATYFVWPQRNPSLLTGVVSATGLTGIKAAFANQYFAGGSGFPDYMIFNASMMSEGARAVQLAGFFNSEWKLQ